MNSIDHANDVPEADLVPPLSRIAKGLELLKPLTVATAVGVWVLVGFQVADTLGVT